VGGDHESDVHGGDLLTSSGAPGCTA
jgi:hypothetical protein